MKLNISFPGTHCQKLTEADDEYKPCTFYEKYIVTEVAEKLWVKNERVNVVWLRGGSDK